MSTNQKDCISISFRDWFLILVFFGIVIGLGTGCAGFEYGHDDPHPYQEHSAK